MAGGRGRTTKKPKFDVETVEELANMAEEMRIKEDNLVDILEFKFEEARLQMIAAYRRDVQRFCEENKNIANMRLVDYLTLLNQQPMAPRPEPESKNEPQKEEEPLVEEKLFPDVIHTQKNKAIRLARPNEIVFSVNGTPISLEQPKTLIRNFTAVTQVTEVLTQSAQRLVAATEEFSEMD